MSDPTLVEAMQLVADALNAVAVGDFTIRALPEVPRGGDRRPGDAWIIPPRITPATFGLARAQLTAVVVLGPDPVQASQRFAALAVPILDAVTRIDGLPVADAEVVPESLLAGELTTGPLFVLTANVSAEVK
jgi:hypothetical protein